MLDINQKSLQIKQRTNPPKINMIKLISQEIVDFRHPFLIQQLFVFQGGCLHENPEILIYSQRCEPVLYFVLKTFFQGLENRPSVFTPLQRTELVLQILVRISRGEERVDLQLSIAGGHFAEHLLPLFVVDDHLEVHHRLLLLFFGWYFLLRLLILFIHHLWGPGVEVDGHEIPTDILHQFDLGILQRGLVLPLVLGNEILGKGVFFCLHLALLFLLQFLLDDFLELHGGLLETHVREVLAVPLGERFGDQSNGPSGDFAQQHNYYI